MRFSRKHQEELIPSVPDDKTDRREAIERARKKLSEASASRGPVLSIVNRIEGHENRNHYRDRLMLAYGRVSHD